MACGRNEQKASRSRPARCRAPDDTRAEQHGSTPSAARERFEALANSARLAVADIGAGPGLLTVHLAKAGRTERRVVGPTSTARCGADDAAPAQRGVADVVERRIVTGDTSGLEESAYDAILLAEVDHYFTIRSRGCTVRHRAQARRPI